MYGQQAGGLSQQQMQEAYLKAYQQQQMQGRSQPQQQQQQQQQMGGGGAAGMQLNSHYSQVTVSGCQNPTVSPIIQGQFTLVGENHGKPVFKKSTQVNNMDVQLYFWDARDGEAFSGWWFGPKVGGEQVWAFNGDKTSMTPPVGNWRVPYDAPVDPSLQLVYGGQKRPADQSAAQQQRPPQPGAPNGYGQQQQQGYGGYGQQQQQARQQQTFQQQQQPQQQQKAWGQEQQQQIQQMAEQRKLQMQQQLMQQQAKMKEQQLAAQQQRQAELLQKQQEMEAKKKAFAEEMARRKAEEEKKKIGLMAANGVRKVIAKLRIANFETFAVVCAEVEAAVEEVKETLGPMYESLKSEAEKAIELKKKQKEDQEAALKAKAEAEEKTKQLLEECAELVKTAEGAKDKVDKLAEPLKDSNILNDLKKVSKAVEEVEAAAKAMDEACKAVTDFIMSNRGVMEAAKALFAETKQKITGHQRTVGDFVKTSGTVQALVLEIKTKSERRSDALKQKAEQEKLFKKYAKTGGKIAKKDMKAMAKAEHKFDLPNDELERLCKRLDPQSAGVRMEDFAKLRTYMGLIKIETSCRQRRKEEEERKQKEKEEAERKAKELEEKKEQLSKSWSDLGDEMGVLEKEITAASEKGRGISAKGAKSVKKEEAEKGSEEKEKKEAIPVTDLPFVEMLAEADEVDKLVVKAKESLAEVRSKAAKNGEDVVPELKAHLKMYEAKLKTRATRAETNLKAVEAVVKAGRTMAHKAEVIWYDTLTKEVFAAIRRKGETDDGVDFEKLFQAIDKSNEGAVLEKDFILFLKTCDGLNESEEHLRKVFAKLDVAGEGKIAKSAILRRLKTFYRVVSTAVFSDGLVISGSKTVRRAEVGEVIELIKGPVPEGSVDVKRIHGKSLKDDLVAWITVEGNQGTIFCQPCSDKAKVVKATDITDSLSIADSKTLRQLKPGEVLEVLEFEQKDADAGVDRIKVLAKKDDIEGFVTVVGNQGAVFLKYE